MKNRKIPSIRQLTDSGRFLPRRYAKTFPNFRTADLTLVLRSNILYEQKAVITDWIRFLKTISVRTQRLVSIIKKVVSLSIIIILSIGLLFSPKSGTSYTSGKEVNTNLVNLAGSKNIPLHLSSSIASDKSPEFVWPVGGKVSQGYTRYHKALDLPNAYNTPVKPIAAGVVENSFNEAYGRGKTIVIRHAADFRSTYAHLNKILVKQNEEVTPEKEIGTVGITGRTSGAHLHLEVEDGGKKINPVGILP